MRARRELRFLPWYQKRAAPPGSPSASSLSVGDLAGLAKVVDARSTPDSALEFSRRRISSGRNPSPRRAAMVCRAVRKDIIDRTPIAVSGSAIERASTGQPDAPRLRRGANSRHSASCCAIRLLARAVLRQAGASRDDRGAATRSADGLRRCPSERSAICRLVPLERSRASPHIKRKKRLRS